MPLEVECTIEEQNAITVSPTKKDGSPSAIEAGTLVVTVTSGAGEIIAVDDHHFKVRPVDPPAPGDYTYLVQGDSDLGAGVQTISDTITQHVADTLATQLGLGGGTAEPRS